MRKIKNSLFIDKKYYLAIAPVLMLFRFGSLKVIFNYLESLFSISLIQDIIVNFISALLIFICIEKKYKIQEKLEEKEIQKIKNAEYSTRKTLNNFELIFETFYKLTNKYYSYIIFYHQYSETIYKEYHCKDYNKLLSSIIKRQRNELIKDCKKLTKAILNYKKLYRITMFEKNIINNYKKYSLKSIDKSTRQFNKTLYLYTESILQLIAKIETNLNSSKISIEESKKLHSHSEVTYCEASVLLSNIKDKLELKDSVLYEELDLWPVKMEASEDFTE